jgi:hypothetical protein
MKKKKNVIYSKMLLGFVIGLLIGVFCFLTVLYLAYQEPFRGQEITDNVLNKAYEKVSNSWEDTQVVNSLAYLCSLNEDDLEKARCVYNFILLNTNYGYHDKMTNILRTPDEIFNQSIVCRDVSVLFKSTLDKMNIRNEFVSEPKHIYNKFYIGENFCIVDIVNGKFNC